MTKRDYSADQVTAAHAAMIELVHLLGEYRDDIVVVGGWVPALLMADTTPPHIGSIDVDLALDHKALRDPGYKTILQLLESRGYIQGEQPFIFSKSVEVEGRTVQVEVNLLAGEYQGSGKSHRTQRIQDVRARKARGCELAFEGVEEITLSGSIPGGAKDTVRIRVASVAPFIIMKAMALHDRMKEKDAWDIVFCLRSFPGGLDALAEKFRPYLENKLVQEGLRKIAGKFESPEHIGPRHVADFEEVSDPDERGRIQRDAFERVAYLLSKLGIVA
jgi:hypothetical protein